MATKISNMPKKPRAPKTHAVWTPAKLKAFRDERDLSQEEAAKLVGVSRRAWIGWEHGERAPLEPVVKLLTLLEELDKKKKTKN